MAGRWGAVLTAMVTPFDENLALDLDAAAELARWARWHWWRTGLSLVALAAAMMSLSRLG